LVALIIVLSLSCVIWWVTYSIREQYLQDDPKLRELKEKLIELKKKNTDKVRQQNQSLHSKK